MSNFAIIYFKDDLWWFQEQGVSGRRTWGGYASKKGAIAAAAVELGDDVRLSVNDPA